MNKRKGKAIIAWTLTTMVVLDLAARLFGPALGDPLRWYSWYAQGKANELSARQKDTDVVFVGSSATAAAFDPSVFSAGDACGRSAYNAALPGAGPSMIEAWLRDVVLKQVAPEYVVLGLTARELRPYAEQALKDYNRGTAVRSGFWGAAERIAEGLSGAVRYRTLIRDPERWVAAHRVGPPALGGEGFSPDSSDAVYSLGEYANAKTDLFANWKVGRSEVQTIRRIAATTRARGITLVIADLAVSEDWPTLFPGGLADVSTYRRAVRSLAAELHVPLIDLTSIALSRSLFLDPIHVNGRGSRLETSVLARLFPLC